MRQYQRNGNNQELNNYIVSCGLSLSVTRKWGERTLSLNSLKWQKLRQLVLEKNHFTCRFCGIQTTKWQVIDHIDGDASNNALENLGVNCCLCDLIRHCGRAAVEGDLVLYYSKKPQIEIVKDTYAYYEKYNKMPKISEIDNNTAVPRGGMVWLANRLLKENPSNIENFDLYKGFFVANSRNARRISDVLSNPLLQEQGSLF